MRSGTPLRYRTTDDMIAELGARRFTLRGYLGSSLRLSVRAKCDRLETELFARGLSLQAIEAIN